LFQHFVVKRFPQSGCASCLIFDHPKEGVILPANEAGKFLRLPDVRHCGAPQNRPQLVSAGQQLVSAGQCVVAGTMRFSESKGLAVPVPVVQSVSVYAASEDWVADFFDSSIVGRQMSFGRCDQARCRHAGVDGAGRGRAM
jgi:hypothetical protein